MKAARRLWQKNETAEGIRERSLAASKKIANAEKKRANAEFKIKFPGQRQKKGELAPISLLCSYCQTAYSEEPQKIKWKCCSVMSCSIKWRLSCILLHANRKVAVLEDDEG